MARTKKPEKNGKWKEYDTGPSSSDTGTDAGEVSELESEINTSSTYAEDPFDNEALSYAKVAGITTRRDRERWSPEAAAFIRSDSGIGHGEEWVGKRPLGKGGFGMAGLWQKRGDGGRPVAVCNPLSNQCGK